MIDNKIWIIAWVIWTNIYLALTAEYDARSTNSINIDLVLNLIEYNATAIDNGVDINFWIKDETSDVHSFPIFNAFGVLQVTLSHDASNNCVISANYNSKTITHTVYTNAVNPWLNVQVVAKSNSMMDLFVWNHDSLVLYPAASFQFVNHSSFASTDLTIYQTTLPEGVMFSELRVFPLISSFCYGRYYHQYALTSTLLSTMIRYTRVTNGEFYLSANINGAPSITIDEPVALDVPIWNMGYKPNATGGCSTWSQTGWQYCEVIDFSFNDLCRQCNASISSCIVSKVCPVDYYKYNGMCLKCPVGWSHCTSATQWTYCDAGLVLKTTTEGYHLCNCPTGNYEMVDNTTDVKSCIACTSPCLEWITANTNCTKWVSNYYLLSDTWITNWGTSNFGDNVTGTCKGCGVNCNVCTNQTTCTTCSGTNVISDGACVASWPSSTLLNGNIWNKCTTGCNEWDTIVTNCTSCISGYYLEGTECVLVCPDGYFGDNVSKQWQPCDATKCQICLSLDTCFQCVASKVLLNYKWEDNCLTGYYEDQYAVDDRVCKSWPVTWAECTSMKRCTYCQNGLYRWTININTVTCVQQWPVGMYETLDMDGVTAICDDWMTDCLEWSSDTTWDYWIIGKVSQWNGTDDNCQSQWNQQYYEDSNGKCQQCPSNCNVCTGPYTCTSCSTGYVLNSTECIPTASCTGKYYSLSGYCFGCSAECATCTSATVCTSWEIGYYLSSNKWYSNCGDNDRDEFEECDDGNKFDGDGCNKNWKVETNYVWAYSNTAAPDTWYWDPRLIRARWIEDWRKIEMIFGNKIKVNSTALANPSSNLHTFCTQILDSSLMSSIGSETKCKILKNMAGQYVFEMELSSDATFGSTQPSELKLKNNLQTTNGCPIGIPLTYHLLSLPIEEPYIVFRESSLEVPKWFGTFLLDIFSSKGFTSRNVANILWTVQSIDAITSSAEVVSLNNTINSAFSGKKFIELNQSTISTLVGKTVEFKVSVTNFLGKTSIETILVAFLNSKKLILDGFFSSYTLLDNQDQKFFFTARIPYCSGDNKTTLLSQMGVISISCELFMDDGLTSVASLTDWKIPAGIMSYPNSYKLKIAASNPSATSQNIIKWADINTKKSDHAVFIHGGDRTISSNDNYTFIASVEPQSSGLVYIWRWIDDLSSTFCKDSNRTYLKFPNNPSMTIPANVLTPNRTYKIMLVVKDPANNRNGTHFTMIYVVAGDVLSVEIDSRHNKNGYINPSKASLFVALASIDEMPVKIDQATFSWAVKDSLNNSVSLSSSIIAHNSLKLSENTLSENEIYTIEVSVSYMNMNGSAVITYDTFQDTSYTLEIEPASGVAFSTDFYITAVSQQIDAELTNFAFGYYKDGVKYLLTRSWPMPLHVLELPQGESSNQLTVFCQIINKEGKEFMIYKTVTVSAPTITESDFETYVDSKLSDSIDESVQVRLQYEYLKESLSKSTKLEAIGLILDGLQRDGALLELDQDEPTSMTVAQTLNIISADFGSLEDSDVVTRSFDIFKQMTITENTEVSSNKRVVVFSEELFNNLFAYADNTLSYLISESNSLNSSKTTTMKATLFEGIEYALRGSMIDQAPGDGGFTLEGDQLSIISSKVTSNGYSESVTLTPVRLRHREMGLGISQLEIPGSALPDSNYAQITVITTSDTIYDINLANNDGILRSGMVRVSIEENDSKLSEVDTKVYSNQLNVSDLTSPIVIKIPFSGSLDTGRTISCGYTISNGDTIKFSGVTSQIDSNTVACYTTHLTDFVLEEHEDTSIIHENLKYPDNSVDKLNVYKAFAFWVSLILFAALYPLIRYTKKKDKLEAEELAPMMRTKKIKINIYNTFWKKVPEKPACNDESEELGSPFKNNTHNLNATYSPMNGTHVTTYMAPRLSGNHSKKDDDFEPRISDISNNYQEPNSSANLKNMPQEEAKDDIFIENIFDKKDNEEELDNANVGDDLADDQKDEIILNLNKRKGRKKKKNKKKHNPEADPDNDEEVKASNDQNNKENGRNPPLLATFDNTYAKAEKKEFKFEQDDDYDGGEGDDEDNSKIKAYDFDPNDAMYDYDEQDNNYLGIKTKKRKKLLKKKKKKSKKNQEQEENNTSAQAFGIDYNENLFAEPDRALSQVREFNSKNSINEANEQSRDDATILGQKDIDAMNDTQPDKSENNDNVLHEAHVKKKKRFYNAKFYCRTLRLGHRYVNFITSYNEHIPRLWRLLIFYNQLFLIMMLSGVVYYNPGPKEDTDSLDGYSSFFYAVLIIGFDRALHYAIVWLILKYKRSGERENMYLDSNKHNNYANSRMNKTDKDILGTEFNKTNGNFDSPERNRSSNYFSDTGFNSTNNGFNKARFNRNGNNIDVSELDKDEHEITDPELEKGDVSVRKPDLNKTDNDINEDENNHGLKRNEDDNTNMEKYETKANAKDTKLFKIIVGVTIFVLAFCFIFTIVMGIRFSNHSGYLWMVAIIDTIFFGHILIEPLVLFGTGLLVHRKLWEVRHLY